MRLPALQIQHANKTPPRRHIAQPHRGNSKDRIRSKLVIALNQDPQKRELVVFVLPIQDLIKDRVVVRWIGSTVYDTEFMLFVGRRFALRWLAFEVGRVDESACYIRPYVVLLPIFRYWNVSGAGDLEAQLLLLACTEIATAVSAKGSWFEYVAVCAGEESLVELHAGVEGLPVQCAYLSTDAPVWDRVEVVRADSRALRVHTHEVLRVMLADVCVHLRHQSAEAGLGNIDEVVMRSILEFTLQPRLISRFD